jgi:mannose-6-phosphate isomerase-like protein (cupin superfamily)
MSFTHPAISLAGSAERVDSISVVEIRIPTAATAGSMSVFESVVAPQSAPPMHIHAREDEFFYVLSGQFQFWCGDESFTGGPGTTALFPRGIAHTYKNIGSEDGRLLVTVTPGGFERFFVDVVAEKAMSPEALMAVGDRYGLTFLPPPEAEAA